MESELGEIHAWVNVAFSGSPALFWDTSAEEYRRMTEVTYFGQVHGTRAALRRMRPRDRGVVVNVGSAMAYRSIPLQSAYCGAKHAVKGFTESVITELAHERSHVKVGVSTAYTILGERLAPKLLDLYLGRTGVTSQQTGEDLPRRGSNVFDPSDQEEDAGAHGPFDDQAHGRDPVLWMSLHRRALGAGALAAVAAAGTLAARRS